MVVTHRCSFTDPVYLIMEYLSKGNLQQHLRSMVNGGGGGTYTNKMTDNQLSPSELLTFGIQISKGMEFLHSKQVCGNVLSDFVDGVERCLSSYRVNFNMDGAVMN